MIYERKSYFSKNNKYASIHWHTTGHLISLIQFINTNPKTY